MFGSELPNTVPKLYGCKEQKSKKVNTGNNNGTSSMVYTASKRNNSQKVFHVKNKLQKSILFIMIITSLFIGLTACSSDDAAEEGKSNGTSQGTSEKNAPTKVFFIELANHITDYLDKTVETTIPIGSVGTNGDIRSQGHMLPHAIEVLTEDENFYEKNGDTGYITVSGRVTYEYSEVRLNDCTILYLGQEAPDEYEKQMNDYVNAVIQGKIAKRTEFLDSAQTKPYDNLRRNPDSLKDVPLALEVSITKVEPDGLFLNGEVYATYQGHEIIIYDEREHREPRLIAGDHLIIYGTERGLTKVKTIASGTGLLGTNLGADVVDETEEVSFTLLYTSLEDVSTYNASDKDEYHYYLKGLEVMSEQEDTTPTE